MVQIQNDKYWGILGDPRGYKVSKIPIHDGKWWIVILRWDTRGEWPANGDIYNKIKRHCSRRYHSYRRYHLYAWLNIFHNSGGCGDDSIGARWSWARAGSHVVGKGLGCDHGGTYYVYIVNIYIYTHHYTSISYIHLASHSSSGLWSRAVPAGHSGRAMSGLCLGSRTCSMLGWCWDPWLMNYGWWIWLMNMVDEYLFRSLFRSIMLFRSLVDECLFVDDG